MFVDDQGPSLEYARDIAVIDATPWEEVRSPEDELIALQDVGFRAELAGDHGRCGRILSEMAYIEHGLSNRHEAAAYTSAAARAFVRGGELRSAIAAYCVLAIQYQKLDSPPLTFGALREALDLRTGLSAQVSHDQEPQRADIEVAPIVTAVNKVLDTYAGQGSDPETNQKIKQPPKSRRPKQADTETLLSGIDGLLDMTVSGTMLGIVGAIDRIGHVYTVTADSSLGLPRKAQDSLLDLGFNFQTVAHVVRLRARREPQTPVEATTIREIVSSTVISR